jgi:hypothetical protein
MPVTVDEIVEAAAKGVLRALEARQAGAQRVATTPDLSALVRSGFFVDIHIRAGGITPGPIWTSGVEAALNPQPLPPGKSEA